jgi:hypothetical protein
MFFLASSHIKNTKSEKTNIFLFTCRTPLSNFFFERTDTQLKSIVRNLTKTKNFFLLKYIKKHLILCSVRQNAVLTSLDFPGLLLVFVEILPDKVILNHNSSYFVSFDLRSNLF